jgi:toxin ParE1/3/4
MSDYRLSRLARGDLDAIWLHVAKDAGVEIADRLISTITGRFPMLAKMPKAGRDADEIEPGVRVFTVERYLIYYRVQRGGISIARVIHGMRDQDSAWQEE